MNRQPVVVRAVALRRDADEDLRRARRVAHAGLLVLACVALLASLAAQPAHAASGVAPVALLASN